MDEQENQDVIETEMLKRAKPYVVITFLMMKHFLLNQIYGVALHFDLNAEIRSKVATLEESVNIIWPIPYAVNEESW